MSNIFYKQWKPLRNSLSVLDMNDTLAVIRAYSGWISYGKRIPLPSDMEVIPIAHTDPTVILPWEMEILAREALIVCDEKSGNVPSIKKWSTFSGVLNKLRLFDDGMVKGSKAISDNILQEVSVRMSHQQFRYQDLPNLDSFVRYSRIFGEPRVAEIVETKTGLTPAKIYTIGAGLWGIYSSQNFGMYYPLDNLDLSEISQEDYDKFMSLYALPLKEIKARLIDPSERNIDETFKYGFHSLQAFPIIFTTLNGRPAHICPMPTLLYFRITTGLFYDVVKEKGFDQAFGSSFEQYIGDVLTESLKSTGKNVYPEEPDSRPKRCDWIIDDTNSFLTVECKTKRMTLGARATIENDDELTEQIGLIADAVVQSYQTLEAYKNNEYRPVQYPFDAAKKPYISVVTLENWYLMGNQLSKLKTMVANKLEDIGLGRQLATDVPFIILSTIDLERLSFLIKTHRISDIIQPFVDDSTYIGWEFSSYLRERFSDDLKGYSYVFQDEIKDVFTVK